MDRIVAYVQQTHSRSNIDVLDFKMLPHETDILMCDVASSGESDLDGKRLIQTRVQIFVKGKPTTGLIVDSRWEKA